MKTLKKALSVLLVTVMLLSAAPLAGFVGLELPELNLPDIEFNFSADAAEVVASGNCGENVTYTLDSDGVLTISGTGAMNDYKSSSSVPWYSNRTAIKTVIIKKGVTSIGNSAFSGCEVLTAVTIPDGVMSIGKSAFSYCFSLTSVTIPKSVTSIGDSAFYWCTSLTDIFVEVGNTAYCSEDGVLYNKSKTELIQYPVDNERTSYSIPDGVKTIKGNAFLNCTKLTSVTIPDSVTNIEMYAFFGCTSLTAVCISDMDAWCNIHFANFNTNPLSFAHNLYLNGTLVTELTIPDSVTNIGDFLFDGCTSLTTVTIPDNVTSIGKYAFRGCTNLTSVTMPDSVTSIGEAAFSHCTKLTSVTIPDSVTSVDAVAFSGCTSLSSITIPDSVTRIGDYAFSNCLALVIRGYPDSYAQQYAEENDIPFIALNGEPTYILGDVDGDDEVTSSDARLALRAAVKLETLTEAQTQAADADKDGEITSSDARLILRAAVGLETL